jgi:phage terminase large subunit-like protein
MSAVAEAPNLTQAELAELVQLLEERNRRASRRKLSSYYPETGPLRRELYPKHMEFFEAGANHRQRCALAANRIGKSEGMGGYELTLHLTGRYPAWWKGRRFDRPIRAWACGKNAETVREILQLKLLGPANAQGTGLIPGDDLARVTRAAGVAESADTVYVRHVSGGESMLMFKSYEQGRRAFEGTEQDVIWLDEEPPIDIFTECLIRTMTTRGIVMCTFTPLLGMSQTVMHFLEGGDLERAGDVGDGRYVVLATWDDAPHLTEADKAELWKSIPAYQRDARTKGVPQLGSGAIYPVPESDIVVADFAVPAHWRKAYGMDVGWNRTAAIWAAIDPGTSCAYLYAEHYRSQAEPVVNAQAVKERGEWIPGAIDPAAHGRGQKDGEQLLSIYKGLGLKVEPAVNAVESGIANVWERLSTGRLKVFASLSAWRAEFRLYRRNEKGQIVKEHDHLMDATRYLVMSGLERARLRPNPAGLGSQRPQGSVLC